MKRALTPAELINKKIDKLQWSSEWQDAFGQPATRGVWFVWGNSGNGKTAFLLQLAKQLALLGDRVIYNSREEGDSATMQKSFIEQKMIEVQKKVILVDENLEELTQRLEKHKSPRVVIIDTIQYMRMNQKKFFDFCDKFDKTHLIIFNSQAEGKDPRGQIAVTAKYHASLKIWVEGFRAFSNGRFYGDTGQYDIWYERAAEYWLSA